VTGAGGHDEGLRVPDRLAGDEIALGIQAPLLPLWPGDPEEPIQGPTFPWYEHLTRVHLAE